MGNLKNDRGGKWSIPRFEGDESVSLVEPSLGRLLESVRFSLLVVPSSAVPHGSGQFAKDWSVAWAAE